MSVNKDRPHVFVLPEDDANRQLADAFHKEVDWARYRQMRVLPEVGGGDVVLRRFELEHVAEWEHPLLRHNASELARLRKLARPILF